MKYTDEKNIQMLIYLLKKNNIRKIIINPGTMNMSFVASVQHDDFFQLYSCVDERSACYMACGLSVESNEPVLITCTGATASRNYMPGLTEAYYRKIPIIALTAAPHHAKINHNIPQVLDRTSQPNDIVKLSVNIPIIYCEEDEWDCNILLNKALLELKHRGGGPVHINIESMVTKDFNCTELPTFRTINRVNYNDDIPLLKGTKKIGIFIGAHRPIDKDLTSQIEEFCEKNNSFVLCDHTSNYFGKYKIAGNLILDQSKRDFSQYSFDLVIHIGDISASYMDIRTKEVWRVNPDGEIKDTFKKLTYVFEMEEIDFFKKYNLLSGKKTNMSLYNSWNNELNELRNIEAKTEYPLSNIWMAKNMINKIDKNSIVHLAILNTIRSWNYFENKNNYPIYVNTGGFGIDGIMSTLIGSSFNNKNKNNYCIIGDLAFFYDLNSIGNRHISSNVRILLINNGCGTEFHNYSHPASVLGNDNISKFIGADGHFGNKSAELVKSLATNLGFEYITATTKDEFIKNVNYFTDSKIHDKPIIFEVFTNSIEEDEALHIIRNLKTTKFDETKDKIKKVIPKNLKKGIKSIIGR